VFESHRPDQIQSHLSTARPRPGLTEREHKLAPAGPMLLFHVCRQVPGNFRLSRQNEFDLTTDLRGKMLVLDTKNSIKQIEFGIVMLPGHSE
jgi:hypothetical protein